MCIVFVFVRFVKIFGCHYNQSGRLKIEILIVLRLARFQNLGTPPKQSTDHPSQIHQRLQTTSLYYWTSNLSTPLVTRRNIFLPPCSTSKTNPIYFHQNIYFHHPILYLLLPRYLLLRIQRKLLLTRRLRHNEMPTCKMQ